MTVFKKNEDFARDEFKTLQSECVDCKSNCIECILHYRMEALEAHFEAMTDFYMESIV